MSARPRSRARAGDGARPRAAAAAGARAHDGIARAGSTAAGGGRSTWLAAVLLVGVAAVAYANSLGGAFVFDDLNHIVENPHIRRLWPPWDVLAGTARPVVMVTLAVNYALGGLAPWGYHLVNLAIHALAGLALFGILRRTFAGPRLGARYGRAATGLALAVAAIWVAHPLNTQAVTYVIQRGESLAGLLYLIALYATIRGAGSRRAGWWYAAAAGSCALGMATKPVVASAPLAVLLYDRFFLAESWREMWQRRGLLHAGLAASWVVGLALAVAAPDPAAGFELGRVTALDYAATQPGVVLHYLRLAVWPQPLVLDYGWPPAERAGAIVAPALALATIVAATLWAAARRSPLGFVGLWFVLVLGPSSSFFPINDLAFEHRMYLPLIAVVVLAVVGAHELLVQRRGARAGGDRIAGALAVAVVALLAGLTMRRNADYASELTIWRDVVAKRPLNPRGHNNLGRAFLRVNDFEGALPELREAVRLAPGYAKAHNNLGIALAGRGRLDEAIRHYREALSIDPALPEARYNLGLALAGRRPDEAVAEYEEALRRQPAYPEAWHALGIAHARAGRTEEAITCYREALRLDPGLAEAHHNLGLALSAAGRHDAAIESYRRALRIDPRVADFHVNLGTALARAGRVDEALAEYEAALGLAPDSPQILNNLGFALVRLDRLDEAIARFRQALRLRPDFALARRNLANALLRQGRAAEAAPFLEPLPGSAPPVTGDGAPPRAQPPSPGAVGGRP